MSPLTDQRLAGATMMVEQVVSVGICLPVGLVPSGRHAKVVEASITLNYTTVLNVAFLALAGLLVWRFPATGGLPMLRHMNDPETTGAGR